MNDLAVMDQLFNVSDISCRDNRVYLSLSVPSEAYNSLSKFIDSLDYFYRLATRQMKFQSALDRAIDPVVIEDRKKNFDSFCTDIFSMYDDLVLNGHSSRSSMNIIKSYSVNHGRHLTVTTIEQLIRKSGRFRKSWSSSSVS